MILPLLAEIAGQPRPAMVEIGVGISPAKGQSLKTTRRAQPLTTGITSVAKRSIASSESASTLTRCASAYAA